MARALSCMCCSFRAQLITFNMQPKCIFLISHFYPQKCLLLSTALLHYFFAYYFALRAHAATKFSVANSNQYSSAFTKPKAVSYFYHHTAPRSPTLQKTPSDWLTKINLTRTTLPISLLRQAERAISLIQSCTT